jgi:hypothetical protein
MAVIFTPALSFSANMAVRGGSDRRKRSSALDRR